MEVSASVIIPFRDRGTDPLRRLNAIRVLEQWGRYEQHGVEVLVASDGRVGRILTLRDGRLYSSGD